MVAKKKSAPKKTAPANTSTDGGWFQTGDAGFEAKAQQDAANEARRQKYAPRFYLKPKKKAGEPNEFGSRQDKARIVFLDNDGFFIHEHSMQVNGKWGNFFTCTNKFTPCPICIQKDNRPGFVGVFTVIDTRKFRRTTGDKAGTVSNFRRQLFPAKGDALERLNEIRQEKGNLRGLVIDISRLGDKEPAVGTHMQVAGRISEEKMLAKFGKDDIVPYDYKEKLAPPTQEELKQLGVLSTVAVGDDEDMSDDEYEAPDSSMSEEEVEDLLD